jgi:type II secretion system protein N
MLDDLALTVEAIEKSESNTPSQSSTPTVPSTGSRAKKTAKTLLWITWGIFWLLVFTVLKLPEDRLQNYIQGSLSALLAPKGITFTSKKAHLSILSGVSYSLEDIELNLPAPSLPVHLEKIVVYPSIFSSILGSPGGSIEVTEGGGKLAASVTMQKNAFNLSYQLTKFDIGKIGLLPVLANFQGSAVIDGAGSLSGELDKPATLSGNIQLNFKNVLIDQQSIAGFSIPRLTISEGKTNFFIEKGKVDVRSFSLGKPGNANDAITGTITGDGNLANPLMLSTMNIRANFSLSDSVHQAFSLIDALLGNMKMPDGSYAMAITGTFQMPTFMPQPK